jgi:hypothetical protein
MSSDQEQAPQEREEGDDTYLKNGRWSADLIHRPPRGWEEGNPVPYRSWPPLWLSFLLFTMLALLIAQLWTAFSS